MLTDAVPTESRDDARLKRSVASRPRFDEGKNIGAMRPPAISDYGKPSSETMEEAVP
jgi:hypothetical protein